MAQSAAVSMSRITQGYEEVMQINEAPVVAGKYIVTPFIFTLQPSFLPVAVAVELPPAVLAAFYVCEDEEKRGGEMRGAKITPRRARKGTVKCRNMGKDKTVCLRWEERGSRRTIYSF